MTSKSTGTIIKNQTGFNRANFGGANFGRSSLEAWCLDPDRYHLNHGAYGALTKSTFAHMCELGQEIEAAPANFIRKSFRTRLRNQIDNFADYVGANADDLVFVENATAGCNAVLRSLVLTPGDEIVISTLAYPSVRQVAQFVAHRAHAHIVEARITPYMAEPSQLLDSILDSFTARTRLVIIDHITSLSAQLMPVHEIAELCRERGIDLLIDGAHAPGQIDLQIQEIGCSWYVGNGHKWFGAPRGIAFIWTAPNYQELMRPTVITKTLDEGYMGAFDWPGSRNFSSWLSLSHVRAERERLGGETLMRRYASELVGEAALMLARRLGGRCHHSPGLAMAIICLPRQSYDPAEAARIRAWLADEYAIDVAIFVVEGECILRISAWIYNEMQDYHHLGDALAKLGRKGLQAK